MTGNKEKISINKHCIIHGHFYQPPRENPWINCIESQESASPYHDWNERILDECYRPNAFSRILDPQGMIKNIHNNYSDLSFNFGPTLLLWIEQHHPRVAAKIIEADRISRIKNNGHGNALAQIYNHIIMPLASRRDQLTQIRWSKTFFNSRFGRDPEGMWLSETAINMETVTCLIEEGIKFVILSPTQAEKYRQIGEEQWIDVHTHGIDPKKTYRIYPYAKSGKQLEGFLDVFFFDEPISRATSFENVLSNADILGNRINQAFDSHGDKEQVVVIATDGETFGHHKPFGDMCLAYFFTAIAQQMNISVTNFGNYLQSHQPLHEVTLKNASTEGTAWSCAHGTGRWIRDCGCKTGGPDSWNQQWRTPLREAFAVLQSAIDLEYEYSMKDLGLDPWRLRDAFKPYEKLISCENFSNFLYTYGLNKSLNHKELSRIKHLLEAQVYIQYSYTSCGWFFTDITGIETIQNLHYACRAIQLGIEEQFDAKIVSKFLDILSTAKSNLSPQTGKTIFELLVKRYRDPYANLCFTAATQWILQEKAELDIQLAEYSIKLKHIFATKEKNLTVDFFQTTIHSTQNCEDVTYSLRISHDNKKRIQGFVLPLNVFTNQPQSIVDIQTWKQDKACSTFTLSDIYGFFKDLTTDYFLESISEQNSAISASIFNQNQTNLDCLSELSGFLPKKIQPLASYLLTEQWNTIIHLIEQEKLTEKKFIQLRKLWSKATKYGVSIDLTKTTAILQRLLEKEMEYFSVNLSLESCEVMRYYLNIVDRFSVPVGKNKLEDCFYSIYTTSIKQKYEEFTHVEAPSYEQKTLMLHLINFTRRMNFNTDTFILKSSAVPDV